MKKLKVGTVLLRNDEKVKEHKFFVFTTPKLIKILGKHSKGTSDFLILRGKSAMAPEGGTDWYADDFIKMVYDKIDDKQVFLELI